MSGDRSLLQLSVGVVLRFDGLDWTVEEIQAQRGRVVLRADSGEREVATIKWLMHHPECRIIATGSDAGSAAAEADSVGRQPPTWRDLTPEQQDLVRLRVGHLLEVETEFRSGDPRRAAPDEPRAAYDPRSTTSGQRRRAKVAELKALGAQEAALLGLHRVSERTLKRMAAGWRAAGLAGCVDGRWLRAGGGHPSIIEPVREAMSAVRAESLHRSRMSMRAKQRLIHQYVLEKYGPDVAVPGYDTLRAVWAEWFGPGGARRRYVRSANTADCSAGYVVVHHWSSLRPSAIQRKLGLCCRVELFPTECGSELDTTMIRVNSEGCRAISLRSASPS